LSFIRFAIIWSFLLPDILLAQDNGLKKAFLVACGKKYADKTLELKYAKQDMDKFYKSLLKSGFMEENIVYLHDEEPRPAFLSEKKKILEKLREFANLAKENDTLVVCFNGHGIRPNNETSSYFLPIDASTQKLETMISMDGKDSVFEILNTPVNNKAKVLLIVGACRNEISIPVQAALKMELNSKDADIAPKGIATFFSCQPGQRTYYDPEKGSYFFDHLSKAWIGEYAPVASDSTSLEDVFSVVTEKTRRSVDEKFSEKQVPDVRRKYDGVWVVSTNDQLAKKHVSKILNHYDSDEKIQIRQFLQKEYANKIEYLEKGAINRNPDLAFLLAECYRYGIGVEQNEKMAISYLEEASKNGHGESMTLLGLVLIDLSRFQEARNWLEKASNRDVSSAMFMQGMIYNMPVDFAPFKANKTEALKWFQRAAHLNHAESYYQIGKIFEDGNGIERDVKKASESYMRSSDFGSKNGTEALKRLFQKNEPES